MHILRQRSIRLGSARSRRCARRHPSSRGRLLRTDYSESRADVPKRAAGPSCIPQATAAAAHRASKQAFGIDAPRSKSLEACSCHLDRGNSRRSIVHGDVYGDAMVLVLFINSVSIPLDSRFTHRSYTRNRRILQRGHIPAVLSVPRRDTA